MSDIEFTYTCPACFQELDSVYKVRLHVLDEHKRVKNRDEWITMDIVNVYRDFIDGEDYEVFLKRLYDECEVIREVE